jgi:hypothetical protein
MLQSFDLIASLLDVSIRDANKVSCGGHNSAGQLQQQSTTLTLTGKQTPQR